MLDKIIVGMNYIKCMQIKYEKTIPRNVYFHSYFMNSFHNFDESYNMKKPWNISHILVDCMYPCSPFQALKYLQCKKDNHEYLYR